MKALIILLIVAMGAAIVAVLYRLYKMNIRRCVQCNSFTKRIAKMFPFVESGLPAEADKTNDITGGKWSVFVFKQCPHCGYTALDRSENKYIGVFSLWYRRRFEKCVFVPDGPLFLKAGLPDPWAKKDHGPVEPIPTFAPKPVPPKKVRYSAKLSFRHIGRL